VRDDVSPFPQMAPEVHTEASAAHCGGGLELVEIQKARERSDAGLRKGGIGVASSKQVETAHGVSFERELSSGRQLPFYG
jgi:hypothetical protein